MNFDENFEKQVINDENELCIKTFFIKIGHHRRIKCLS